MADIFKIHNKMGFLDQSMSVTAQETFYITELVNAFYSNDKIVSGFEPCMHILSNLRHSMVRLCVAKTVFKRKFFV
jgi:hypothetical protein